MRVVQPKRPRRGGTSGERKELGKRLKNMKVTLPTFNFTEPKDDQPQEGIENAKSK